MKHKFLLSFFSFILLSSFIFLKPKSESKLTLNSSTQQQEIPETEFLIGAMGNGWDTGYSEINQLSSNVWHSYGDPEEGWSPVIAPVNTVQDNINSPVSAYKDEIKSKIELNRNNGFRSFMDRPFIQYLALAQRSEYQCEQTHQDSDLWFYTYNNSKVETTGEYEITDITDNSGFGSGQKVKHCKPITVPSDPDAPRFIVSGLKANREQANRYWSWWIADSARSWYIKPRIRADQNFVNNNPDEPICRIDIEDWNGDLVKSVILKGRNFFSQGSYNGIYKEEFDFSWQPINTRDTLIVNPGWLLCPGDRKPFFDWNYPIHTDYKIHWYGTCEMWVDYIRVENEPSHLLHNGDHEDELDAEIEIAMENYDINNPKPNIFYIEEFEFNTLPAIKYINSKIINDTQGKLSLAVVINYDLIRVHKPNGLSNNNLLNRYFLKKFFIDYADIRIMFSNSYSLEGWSGIETDGFPSQPLPTNTAASKHPSTLYSGDYDRYHGVLSGRVTPDEYDTWLQQSFDCCQGGTRFTYNMKVMDSLSKMQGAEHLRLLNLHQSHSHYAPHHKLNEPSNEEIELMGNLAISYGAKGIMYFSYFSIGSFNDDFYIRGMVERDPQGGYNFQPRNLNAYGQDKWQKYIDYNAKLKEWGPHIIKFKNTERKSYIFRLSGERSDLLSQTYFNNVYSYQPLPQDLDEPDINQPEDPGNSYLQVSTFKNNETFSEYFMIQNRRCSPYLPGNDENGGRRYMKIQFDQNSNEFSGFNNWAIIDLETDQTVATFDKNNFSTVDLGWYLPGEGKLYKIAPVMQEGGTLVTDEAFEEIEFNCNGDVYNNGYDITIGTNTIINFAYNTKIEMTGGNFICNSGNDIDINYFRGLNNEKWEGLIFNSCPVVNIQATEFDDLISPGHPDDFNFALKFIDCEYMLLRYNFFSGTNTSPRVGAVSIDYLHEPNWENQALDVFGNMFDYQSLVSPVIKISNYAFTQSPLLMRFNHFKGNNNSNNAVFLNNVTGGVMRNNKIEGFYNGVHSAVSYIDFYSNEVSNTGYDNYNLNLNAGSYFNLKTEMGIYYLGGFNKLNTSGDLASNIFLQNSYFDADKGFNVFNVKSGYAHFTGTLNDDYFTTNDISILDNCFKADNDPDDLNQDLSWEINLNSVNFITGENNCDIYSPESFEIVYFGDIEDTLWFMSGGIGGGSKENKGSNKVSEITSGNFFKLKSDSLKVLMRKRKFNDVTRIGNELLNIYPDSAGIINIIQPLYFATLVTDDSTDTKISNYKTKLESVISSNGNNPSLVLRCNYFIQKCKVKLGDYQSALSGFQQIMNSFPYSWEGIVASWDYSATQLLVGGGSGQGVKVKVDHELHQLNEFHKSGLAEAKKAEKINETENYDDRFKKSVSKTLSDSRENSINELKKDEEKIIEIKKSKSDEPSLTKTKNNQDRIKDKKDERSIEKKIEQKRVINESIKPRKPESIIEQINFVNNDIKKIISVTGSTESDNPKGTETPIEYSLSQNYPNPFNPNTKISFSLPKDTKVTLVIYDILGREIAKLVNNELKPTGTYTYDFNASRLASGIYFYSIITDEFKQTKRMVLVK